MAKRRRRRKQKAVIIGVLLSFTVLVGLYVVSSFYFDEHFFFRTKINGWRVGGMNLTEAEAKVGDGVEDYLLTVFDRDGGKHHVYGKDIECSYVPDGSVKRLLDKQNPIQWVSAVFNPQGGDVPITMDYKEELISQAVKDMDCFQEENITEPESARIELGEDGYYIEPEAPGNRMDFESVLAKVKQAVSEGASSVQLTDEDYVSPEYTSESDEIVATIERINNYENAVITYQIKDYEESLGKEQIRDFLVVDGFEVSLQEDKITDYVQMLASKYNTYADVRTFRTSSNDTVEIGGGDYGWIVDKQSRLKQIERLAGRSAGSLSIPNALLSRARMTLAILMWRLITPNSTCGIMKMAN